MVLLKYFGGHQESFTVEVDEVRAKGLLARGDYIIEGQKLIPPNELLEGKWTEKKIKQWLLDNNVSINYNITDDEKKDVIEKIKKYFGV